MKMWKVLSIDEADDKLLEAILNYDMERKGRVVKEIILSKDSSQYKIIYTEEDVIEE